MTGPLNPPSYNLKARFNARKSKTDNYETPAWATEALVNALRINAGLQSRHAPAPVIWDPCCGRGAIAVELKRLLPKLAVYGSDIRPCKKIIDGGKVNFLPEMDFLTEDCPINASKFIVMNPPFSIADDMVLRALETPGVAMVCCLQRTQYMEGDKRYKKLFSKYPETFILHFIHRVSMEQEGQARVVTSGMMTFSWFVWIRTPTGWGSQPPSLVRLDAAPAFEHDRRLAATTGGGEVIEVKDLLSLKAKYGGYLYRQQCSECGYSISGRQLRTASLRCLRCSALTGSRPGDEKARAKFDQKWRVA